MLLKVKAACRLRDVDGKQTAHVLAAGKYLEARFRKFVGTTQAWKTDGHSLAWNVYVIGSGLRLSNSRVGYVPDDAVEVINAEAAVRYGMVTGGGVVVQERCPYCDHAAGSHVVQQSDTTRAAVDTLRNWMLNGPGSRRQGVSARLMLGALTASDGAGIVTYVSNSGQQSQKVLDAAQANGFVYAPPIRVNGVLDAQNLPRGVLNRRNEAASNGTLGFMQNFEYQCAAPNMIQKALYDGHRISAMTEAFFGSGEVQASCSRCQQTVPFMLCHAPRPFGLG